MTPENVVVVGGGLGGVSTCIELRRLGYAGAITLVDPGRLLHDRPPLSKEFLLGGIDTDGLRLQSDEWFAENNVTVRTGESVVRVVAADPSQQGYAELADGFRIPADAVVLATGGTARRLPVPGGEGPRVHYLRTLDDAERLRPALVPGARVMVVGGGLIGAEIAATAQALGCTVTLTDPVLPLEAGLGADLATWLHDMHRTKGVDLLAGGVVEITDRPDGVTVHLADHDPVDADVVIVGIGMVPDVAVAAASGATVDDGVIVDGDQHTSIPGLYAIGDCCRVRNDDGTIRPRAEHWEAASADAARAAAAILGQPRPADQAPWFWSDRHGHHVEVVGDLRAGSPVVRGTFGEPPFAVLSLADGVVVGAASVDDPQTVRAARRLIDRRTPVSADELASGDLRKLARKKG